MKPFIDLQMLQDATRRCRSSKTTKQTRSRRCKTFKCCKILLEEGGYKVASTRHHRARLLKYYPSRLCAPSFVKSGIFRPLQTHFLLFQQIFFVLACIHPGTPRVPPRAQNPAGAINRHLTLHLRYFRNFVFIFNKFF